jgi:hypothetical protein
LTSCFSIEKSRKGMVDDIIFQIAGISPKDLEQIKQEKP